MDAQTVAQWLQAYIQAWRSNDRDLIEALFTDDAEYRYTPYEEPIVGAAAIAAHWLEDPDDPDSWQASYVPIAVDGDVAVAAGVSRYRETPARPQRTYHNCFILRFADDGRCAELTEYYLQEPPDPAPEP